MESLTLQRVDEECTGRERIRRAKRAMWCRDTWMRESAWSEELWTSEEHAVSKVRRQMGHRLGAGIRTMQSKHTECLHGITHCILAWNDS